MRIELTEKELDEYYQELKKGKCLKLETSNDEILFLRIKKGGIDNDS